MNVSKTNRTLYGATKAIIQGKRIHIQRISAFTDEGGRRFLQGCKTTVGTGSLNLVASQMAMLY
jgi:hypothetical protein